MKRFIWAGPNPHGNQWSRLKGSLETLGVVCAKKWISREDVNDKIRCDFVICAAGNPMYKRVCEYARKKGVLILMPNGKSFGAVKKCLQDNGLIDENSTRVANLHGFHDEAAAEIVNPVTHPLLTEADVARMTDKIGVWRDGDKVKIFNSGGTPSRPVFVDRDFYISISKAADVLNVTAGLISNAVIRGEAKINGRKLRWANFDESMKNISGSFHDKDREPNDIDLELKGAGKNKTVKTDRPIFICDLDDRGPRISVWVEGSMVVTRNPNTGRAQRPVTLDGEAFASVTSAGEFLETSGGSVTCSIQEGREIRGFKVHYSTLEEALSLPGAFRDEGLDRDRPREGFGKRGGVCIDAVKKAATVNPKVVVRPPPTKPDPEPATTSARGPLKELTEPEKKRSGSRLINAIVGILNDGVGDDAPKMTKISALLDYDDEDSKLTNALRGADSLSIVRLLIDYELGSYYELGS